LQQIKNVLGAHSKLLASCKLTVTYHLPYSTTPKRATNQNGQYHNGHMLWSSERRTCEQLTAPCQSRNY